MRGGARSKAPCHRCGKLISERSDGSGPVAHQCPHGKQCIAPAWGRHTHFPRPECCIQADLQELESRGVLIPLTAALGRAVRVYFRKRQGGKAWHIARADHFTVCGLPMTTREGFELTQDGACAEHAATVVCKNCERMADADSVILATRNDQVYP